MKSRLMELKGASSDGYRLKCGWVFSVTKENVKIREMLGLQSVNLAIKRCTLGRFHAWNIT